MKDDDATLDATTRSQLDATTRSQLLFNWASVQPWWPIIVPLMRLGLAVGVYVPGGPPEECIMPKRLAAGHRISILHWRPKRVKVLIAPCGEDEPWHIVVANRAEVEARLRGTGMPDVLPTVTWARSATGEA
jgi:hypothetical protein